MPSPAVRVALTALVLSLAAVRPLAAERLLVRVYTVADGLPDNRIAHLGLDSEGFLWIGTGRGLTRFDGVEFTTYGTDEGLPDPVVNHVLETRDGTRWVATNGGGIARLEGSQAPGGGWLFTPFDVGEGPRAQRVNLLYQDRTGALLAGTDGGLFRSADADREPRFELVELTLPGVPDAALQVWSMLERRGALWVGTSAGLVRIDRAGGIVHVPVQPAQGADHVWAMIVDEEGRLWLGHDQGLFIWYPPAVPAGAPTPDQGQPSPAPAPAGPLATGAASCVPGGVDGELRLPALGGEICRWHASDQPGTGDRVRSFRFTEDGHLWMTTLSGLVEFDGRRLHLYAEAHGLPDRWLGSLARDSGGDLWVGAERGLFRVGRQGLVHYTEEDGLADQNVRQVFGDRHGRLYAVTSSAHIHRFEGNRWTAVRPNLPAEVGRAGRGAYGAALLTAGGEWWVGTGEGLFRFPPVARLEELAEAEPSAHYTSADGLAGNDIWSLFEDSRGDVWIGTRIPADEPLTRWQARHGGFRTYGVEDGLPPRRAVRLFAEDHAGGVWVGFFDGGLARFDGVRFRYLAPDRTLPRGEVSSLHVDARGRLWATVGEALVRIDDPAEPRSEPRIEPALAGPIRGRPGALTGDGEGQLYVTTANGLLRLDPDRGRLHHLVELDLVSVHNAYRDRGGELWLATGGGLLRYEPRSPPASGPPPVWIGGLRVAGVPRQVPAMGAHALPPLDLVRGESPIEIDYFGLALAPHQPLRFQYRLAGNTTGIESGWSPASTRRSVTYANLAPGRYRFEVRAVDASGLTSPQPATVQFTLPPPIWRRWWFVTGLGVALAGLLAILHRYRVERAVELERVRTRIAADLHDELGAGLSRISLLTEVARRATADRRAAEPMAQAGEVARRLVGQARDVVWSLNPRFDDLESFLGRLREVAGELLEPAGIGWRLVAPEADVADATRLRPELRRCLLPLVKESLHNVVRHAAASHVEMTIGLAGRRLTGSIADDGRGFDPAGPRRASASGLAAMQKRLEELGGELTIDSAPGRGTRISFTAPL